MKKTNIVLGITCLCLGQMAWAQNTGVNGIPGTLNPATGTFQPGIQPLMAEASSLASVAPHTGTFEFDITITIKSTLPTTDIINCNATASTTDMSGLSYNTIMETASATAVRTGSTAKCTVKIPYSWALLSPTTDQVSLNYTITAINPSSSNSSSATGSTGGIRSSTQSIGSSTVPANGATTIHTISAVI